MRFGIQDIQQMHISTNTPEIKPPALPLFSWAARHRSRPRERITWQIDRHCRVVTFKREVRS